jgi:hypothetical protein
MQFYKAKQNWFGALPGFVFRGPILPHNTVEDQRVWVT